MTCILDPSKGVPRVPIRKVDDHHPSVESPVKAIPGHMAVGKASMTPPTSP